MNRRPVVMKFGGTSVADRPAIRRLVSIVRRERTPDATTQIVVVSALADVTDRLLAVAELACDGELERASRELAALRARHLEVAAVVENEARLAALEAEINDSFADLADRVRAVSGPGGKSPPALDAMAAAGELLSSRIVASALDAAEVPAVWVDARRIVMTDAAHGRATPLMDETAERIERELAPHLAGGRVPVLGGFIGATPEGATTTLGRGGSDYSAAILGALIQAAEIQIWTDVDGMLTADPRVAAGTRLVPHLSFAEASELAYFGAKVLHPSTIQPAAARDVPVRILNSTRARAEGTLITASAPPAPATVRAIASKRDITLVNIVSTRMLMAYGFLRRLFEVFENFRTSVDVVATSEVSVSVTIDEDRHLQEIVRALGEFADVSSEREMALVSLVGEGLCADSKPLARALDALDGVSLRVVSQAGSSRSISFVLSQAALAPAIARLHTEFFESDEPADATASAARGESRLAGR